MADWAKFFENDDAKFDQITKFEQNHTGSSIASDPFSQKVTLKVVWDRNYYNGDQLF